MAAQKVYSIQINGLTESVKAVDALNESLKNLESRIKALEGKSVKVGASSSGGGSKSSSTSSLSEEEKLEKQIAQLEEKRIAHSKQIYQNYLAAKDVLSETEKDQKQIAASERLAAKSYSNTIAGMKQELADIKAVMQTVDVGDGDQMKQMIDRAKELNDKLKEIEQSYGQFGRNVGNYANGVAEGMQKVKVQVGDSVREFSNAREASRTLNNELKAMAVNGQSNTKEYKELRQAVMELESTFNDAKKPMDNLMDTMQSIVAIGSLTQSFSALFGFDDSEIQRSIQKLVALQNILNSINTLNNQIQTREGIGRWIAPFTTGIDKATAKLLVFNRALLGTGKAAKVAAGAINLFGKALKGAISLGTMLIIDQLIEGLMKLVDGFKTVDKAAEAAKETQEEVAKAYAEGSANILKYQTIVKNFNGTRKEEANLVKELNSELGSSLGTYKTLAQWMDVLTNKGAAYIKMLTLQAKAQAAFNNYVKALEAEQNIKEMSNEDFEEWWQKFMPPSWTAGVSNRARVAAVQTATAYTKSMEEELTKSQTEVENFMESHEIGDYAPQIEKNGKKSADAAKKAQEEITSLQLRTMKDGLNKQLMQLEEEKRQTINKIKENGNRVGLQIKQVEEAYNQIRLNTIQDYLDKLRNAVAESAKKISGIRFSIDKKDIELDINEIEEKIKSMTDDVVPVNNTLTTHLEYEEKKGDLFKSDFAGKYLALANEYQVKQYEAESKKNIEAYYDFLNRFVSRANEKYRKLWVRENPLTGEMEVDYDAVESYIELHFKKELDMLRSYGYQANASLSSSFEYRLKAVKAYNKDYITEIDKLIKEEEEKQKTAAAKEQKNLLKENDENYRIEMNSLNYRKVEIEDALKAIEKINTASTNAISEKFKKSHEEEIKNLEETNGIMIKTYEDYYKSLKMSLEKNLKKTNEQLSEIEIQHADKMQQIEMEYQQKLNEIERSSQEKRQQNQQRYYDQQLSNYRDFLSKINTEASKQPVTDKAGWGIVNVVQTKRNYKEILESTKQMFLNIKEEKEKLNEDWKKGLVSPENYNSTLNQLNDLETETIQTAQTVGNNLKMVNANFVQSIQMYLQEALNSFNTIMQAIWQMEDNEFDDEQERLDKENEMIQDKLSKQADIISQYKSTIDSIEDELATSRGDRRQHLIDQLNAEMEAERRAQKEKENLQKQEERNKKKQEDLEKKRKKSQYNRDKLQAIVNGAMAVTYAAINKWPIPAIPMMALAASTTAAQLAIMAANKPYRVGGQLEGGLVTGKRHTQGGVPVGNTGIEVEGSEYIIRRESTTPNLNLLEFINKSQKKLDLSDFIDFYAEKPRKVIKGIQKRTFADGGVLPTLPNALDVRDQLQNVIINQDNRPVYVAVTDILNKADDVRNVQVLAGLTPSSI